jgi:hypothetical protein
MVVAFETAFATALIECTKRQMQPRRAIDMRATRSRSRIAPKICEYTFKRRPSFENKSLFSCADMTGYHP